MKMKLCNNCKVDKEIDGGFYGGGRSQCKECERTAAKYRMGRTENKIRTAYRDAKKAARKHGVYDDLTLDDVMYTYAIAGGRCAYCGKIAGRELNLEHICTLSRRGHNTLANITTSCTRCNSRKSDSSLLTHLQTNTFEVELMQSLINRMAFRKGVERWKIVDTLNEQQRDFSDEDITKLMQRIKGRGS